MIIANVLKGVQRLGVDTAPFIYYVEDDGIYAKKMDAVIDFVEANNIPLVTSTVTLLETLVKPLKESDKTVEQAYRELLSTTSYLSLQPITSTVASQAATLRATYNLKTPDALQIAATLENGCDAFLTNDLGLKRVNELRVLVIDEMDIK
jgi:predicted nucleic acid-binding protein